MRGSAAHSYMFLCSLANALARERGALVVARESAALPLNLRASSAVLVHRPVPGLASLDVAAHPRRGPAVTIESLGIAWRARSAGAPP